MKQYRKSDTPLTSFHSRFRWLFYKKSYAAQNERSHWFACFRVSFTGSNLIFDMHIVLWYAAENANENWKENANCFLLITTR